MVVVMREVVLRGATKGSGHKDSGHGRYEAYLWFHLRSKKGDDVWEASLLSQHSGSRDSQKRSHFLTDKFICIVP
jgi:hypothetical protein